MRKLLILLLGIFLVGCEQSIEVTPSVSTVQIEYSDFDLTVDNKTKIVYIDNTIKIPGDYGSKIYHIYTPYLSETGRACKFRDGGIYEIIW